MQPHASGNPVKIIIAKGQGAVAEKEKKNEVKAGKGGVQSLMIMLLMSIASLEAV